MGIDIKVRDRPGDLALVPMVEGDTSDRNSVDKGQHDSSDHNGMDEGQHSPPGCHARLCWFSLTFVLLALAARACQPGGSHRPAAHPAVAAGDSGGKRAVSESRELIISPAEVGAPGVLMSWMDNTERCVGVPGGLVAARSAAHLELVSCSEEDALLFSLPTPAGSQVHLTSKPELCLDNPSLTVLQLWDCNDTRAEAQDNMRFVLQADGKNGSASTIRMVTNKTRCMDVLRDEVGAPVQMWECFPDLHHELFQLRVRDSGPPAASKSGRWLNTDGNESSKGRVRAGAQASSPTPAPPSEATELMDSSARALGLDDKDSGEEAATVSVDEPANVSGAGELRVVMRWEGNMNRCVGVRGGLERAVRAAQLQLVSCSGGDALVFSLPTPGDHRFHLSAKSELCVDNPGLTRLQLWDCNDTRSEVQDNMQFALGVGGDDQSMGTIRTIKNRSRCMDVPRDEVGAPVQIWECFPDFKHQVFQLRVGVYGGGHDAEPSADVLRAPAPAETSLRGALIVLSRNGSLDRCVGLLGGLMAAKRAGHLKLASCSEEDALVFSVPTPSDPHLRLMAKPGLCVGSMGSTDLQLRDCNDTSVPGGMTFFVRADGKNNSEGTIRTMNNKSMCMSCSAARIGAPVRMHKCRPDFRHQLFKLRADSGGGAAKAASKRKAPPRAGRGGGSKASGLAT